VKVLPRVGTGRAVLAAVAVSLVAAGCGQDTRQEATVSTTLPTQSFSTSSVSSTASQGTTAASSTTVTSGTVTTTTTALGPPLTEEGLPVSLGADQVPWAEVGEGWLLVRYGQARSPGEAGGEFRTALFLVDPGDTVYFVAWWPNSEWILDWSPEGGRVLSYRDGALVVTDLKDDTAVAVPDDIYGGVSHDWEFPWARWARFTRPTGRDLVVRLVQFNQRARLEGLHTDGTRFAQLVDLDLTPLVPADNWQIIGLGINDVTWLYAESGTELVVATTEGISLVGNSGAIMRHLDAPGIGCTLSRWWDQGSVLAACYEPAWVASPCWGRGQIGPGGGRILWAVPLDGSAATRLSQAVTCDPETGSPEYWAAYIDAVQVGGVLALESETCCVCGSVLNFVAGGTVTAWDGYQGSPPCAPQVIGRRGDGFAVFDIMFSDQGGEPFGTLFQTAPDGTVLYPITPFSPGDSGGVVQVLTTEQTVR
jgi:hypothetical protein